MSSCVLLARSYEPGNISKLRIRNALDYDVGMEPEDIPASWSKFVQEAIGNRALTNGDIGEMIGVSESMVGNWINATGSRPKGENVVAFARKFGPPLYKALVAAGYGEEREYRETVVVPRDVTDMSADEMIDRMVMMLARIREIMDAPPAPSPDKPPKRKRRFRPRGDAPGL